MRIILTALLVWGILLTLAVKAFSQDIAPVIAWNVEVTEPTAYNLSLRSGETVILQPQFRQAGAAKDLTGASAVVLRYRPTGSTSVVYAATGAVHSATSGVCRIRWDASTEGSNTLYQYEVAIMSTNATLLRSWGAISIAASLSGTPTTPPTGSANPLEPSEPEPSYPNDIAPVIAWNVDVTTLNAQSLYVRQGETCIMRPRFVSGVTPVNLSGAAAVALRYRPIGASGWHYVTPGYIHNATNGQVGVRWSAAVEGTNTSYQYEIAAQSPDATLLRAFGVLTVVPSLYGSATAMPARVTTFDWSAVDHVSIGSAPFLSEVSMAPFAAFDASLQDGSADIDVDTAVVRGSLTLGGILRTNWGGEGIGTYTNTQINGQDNTNGIFLANGSNTIWRFVNGVWMIDVPIIQGPAGPQGAPGQAVTNLTIAITTNLTVVVVTNVYTGGGGGGSSVYINGQLASAIGDSATATWSVSNGVWSVESIGGGSSTGLNWVIDGQEIGYVDTDGITMLQGSLRLFEEDLTCNVRLYDGSRLSPSLTFEGHTNEWGLYARGYNGTYAAGWSMAGTEIGVLHGNGITLMDSNAVFTGKHSGDISDCFGYIEHEFRAWNTNMSFSSLILSNLVVVPGSISVKDPTGTVRVQADSTSLTVKDAAGISRMVMGAQLDAKNETGQTITKFSNGMTTYDAVSQMPILMAGSLDGNETISCKNTAGQYLWRLNQYYGLRLYDGSLFKERARVDVLTGLTTFDSSGTNVLFNAGVDGTCKIRGMDTDTRYARATTGMTGFVMTNVFGGVTQRVWFSASGVVTNHVP